MARGGNSRSEVEIGANSRRLNPDLRKARNKFDRFGKDVQKRMRKSFSGIRRDFGTLVGFAGVGSLAVAGRQVMEFEKNLTRLQIQSGKSTQFMAQFRDVVRSTSSETGVSADELLAAGAKFVSITGDMDTAAGSMALFARVAQGSGAALEDVAATAASLTQNLGITDPREMEQAFGVLVTQGKRGAIEIKELSTLLSTVAPQFASFGNTGASGLAELGAQLQVIRRGFGSGAEAVTGMQGLMTALTKNADRFRAAGVKIYEQDPKTGRKNFRNFSAIIEDIGKSKLMKDPTALAKAFGRTEALRAFQQIVGASAEDMAKFNISAEEAGKVINSDFKTFADSSAGRMAQAWEQIRNAFARVLTPQRIQNLASAFEKLAKLVGFLADHLETVAGIMIAAKVGSGFGALASISAGFKGGGIAANIKAAGQAMGVEIAAVVGFSLGKLLDEHFGISDKVSDFLVNTDGRKALDSTGYIRDRAMDLANAQVSEGVRVGAGLGYSDETRRDAAGLINTALERGLVNKDLTINQENFRKLGDKLPTEESDQLAYSLKYAAEIFRDSAKSLRTPDTGGRGARVPTQSFRFDLSFDSLGTVAERKARTRGTP